MRQLELEARADRLTNGLFGGMNLVPNRFTGPGRIYIQSMCSHCVSENRAARLPVDPAASHHGN